MPRTRSALASSSWVLASSLVKLDIFRPSMVMAFIEAVGAGAQVKGHLDGKNSHHQQCGGHQQHDALALPLRLAQLGLFEEVVLVHLLLGYRLAPWGLARQPGGSAPGPVASLRPGRTAALALTGAWAALRLLPGWGAASLLTLAILRLPVAGRPAILAHPSTSLFRKYFRDYSTD